MPNLTITTKARVHKDVRDALLRNYWVTKGETMFLTRPEHDQLLESDQPLLQSLFNELGHRWSIGGVRFRNVPAETVIAVHLALATKGN